MFDTLVHQIGRVAYPLIERFSTVPWDNAPRPPSSRAVARGAGHDPDRVLLTGGSSSVGWGVVTHDLGLAGHLARATAAATGRGADVEVFSYPRLEIPAIQRTLGHSTISRFDAIVLTLGGRESFELLPVRTWRAQVAGLLDHISSGREAAPGVIVVGAEEVSPVPLGRVASSIAMDRARAFNEATREIIAHRERVTFVASAFEPLAGTGHGVLEEDNATLYFRCAQAIAPTLVQLLNEAPDRVRRPVDDDARGAAVQHVRAQLDVDNPRITELLTTVQDALHKKFAVLFLVDHDSVTQFGSPGMPPRHGPRDEALSTESIEHPGGLVIRDLAADPRHRDRPGVLDAPFVRFYASYPIESPDGHPVAVLTVVDPEPGDDLTPTELSLLRQFAHRAGALLFEGY